MKKTACKNGMCECLYNDKKRCDYRNSGKMIVYIFMHQETGKCMHKNANKQPKRHDNKNANFYLRSCAQFAENQARKA